MTFRPSLLLPLLLTSCAALCQTPAATLPAGTPLAVQIDDHLPMRIGQPVRADLLYAVYVNNVLILPKNTVLTGTVTALNSDRPRRIRATLGGDFTPFHIPVVLFTRIILPDGTALPFSSTPATDGAPIYRIVAPPPAKGGFLRQEFNMGVAVARDDLALFTAPGKGDRLKQFVYTQIPYHPQRIEKGTAWTVETSASLAIPAQPAPPALPPPVAAITRKPHFWEQPTPAAAPVDNGPGRWIIQAYLNESLSSETSKTGQAIQATVAEPIYNPDHTIAIPEGATLVGAVTQAKPSRRFGRTGNLSFSFRQLILPLGKPENVETTLTGADSAQALALNSEGQVKSKPQDKLSIPLLLALMASRPLDQDHHDTGSPLGKNAIGGAAGLGLVGTILGLSGGSPNAAAGIGYYGAARAVYYRWIARGNKITFARNTRIVVQTVARSSAVLKPNANTSR